MSNNDGSTYLAVVLAMIAMLATTVTPKDFLGRGYWPFVVALCVGIGWASFMSARGYYRAWKGRKSETIATREMAAEVEMLIIDLSPIEKASLLVIAERGMAMPAMVTDRVGDGGSHAINMLQSKMLVVHDFSGALMPHRRYEAALREWAKTMAT